MNALSSKLHFYNTVEDPMDGGATKAGGQGVGLLRKLIPGMATTSLANVGQGEEEEKEGLIPSIGNFAKSSIRSIHDTASGAVNNVKELTISREKWIIFFVAEGLGA